MINLVEKSNFFELFPDKGLIYQSYDSILFAYDVGKTYGFEIYRDHPTDALFVRKIYEMVIPHEINPFKISTLESGYKAGMKERFIISINFAASNHSFSVILHISC